MNRRQFIKQAAIGSTALSIMPSLLSAKGKKTKLTILHTNDMHSRIEPFPMNDKRFAGKGGFARLKTMIEKIRSEEKNIILLDSGDVFQGTPYFNMYKGELEYKLMSAMGYDAGTIGNHEFDDGMENIAKQMQHLNFPLVSANYDFSKTVLSGKIPPHTIVEKSGKRIGIYGLGVAFNGLVDSKLSGEAKYLNPVEVSNKTAKYLKEKEKCDIVVCLSHLGYSYKNSKISDTTLVKQIRNVDVILGGHTHTLLEKPETHQDMDGNPVIINQVGWAGIALGRIDLYI